MNCPYCNQPMKRGYLQSGQGFIWSSEKKEDIFIASKDSDINFRKRLFKGCYVESWYCADCKKLVTDVTQK